MSKAIHSELLERTYRKYADLHSLIDSNGVKLLKKRNPDDFFTAMARTVAGQQLSTKAADTIWNRLLDASSGRDQSLEQFCTDENVDEIRRCGISGSKTRAIVLLNKAVAEGTINPAALMKSSHQEIRAEVIKLWGFGPWSADMMAMFFFANHDVWAAEDVSLQKGLQWLSDNKPKRADAILKCMTPYRTFLALHIYEGLDAGKLG